MRKNKPLEEHLRLAGNGKDVEKRGTNMVKPRIENCLVLGDSIVKNVGAEKSNIRVENFPGIRTDKMRRVIIHVETDNIRRYRNLDYVMGEVYDLVNTAKTKFPGSRLVLSGVLRTTCVS
jgi:hypothetical protein